MLDEMLIAGDLQEPSKKVALHFLIAVLAHTAEPAWSPALPPQCMMTLTFGIGTCRFWLVVE